MRLVLIAAMAGFLAMAMAIGSVGSSMLLDASKGKGVPYVSLFQKEPEA
jgi:hypothetical protein